MMRLPYGIGDFAKLRRERCYYADKTPFIEELENMPDSYIFLLRPRRFGKSLFLSVLHYYYGLEYKNKFQDLFAPYYIGQNPTPRANSYFMLRLNFSGIDTRTPELAYRDFLDIVERGIRRFLGVYKAFFGENASSLFSDLSSPQEAIRALYELMYTQGVEEKLYVLIDEYDHFANELLAFHFEDFKVMVGENGWVRKFYETLKIGADEGLIDQMFITGISPITLDSMTSGFNIGTNISSLVEFNDMMGFTEKEVTKILEGIGVGEANLPIVQEDVKLWYDGYLFHKNARQRMYNSAMLLYFSKHFERTKKYPDELLDINIASDYSKVEQVFKIGGKEKENLSVLKELLENGSVSTQLTRQFSFKREFTRSDLISVLFYNGIVSIAERGLDKLIFKMPNYVIKQLYYQYFYNLQLDASDLHKARIDVGNKVDILAQKNKLQSLIAITQNILTELSNRDKQQFDEKHIKLLFTSLFYQVGYYTIFNELEVKKSETEKGCIDLLLVRRPPFQPNYQFIFELKYLAKKKASKLEEIKKEAEIQLREYLQSDKIKELGDDLKAYIVVFVGNKGHFWEI